MELHVILGEWRLECVNYEVHGRNHLFITVLRLKVMGDSTVNLIRF